MSYPDCVIAVLPGGRAGIGAAERRALRVLADAGLIPETGHMRNTSPARLRIDTVKTGPSVGESVEAVPALH
jgi:hypothetical protein